MDATPTVIGSGANMDVVEDSDDELPVVIGAEAIACRATNGARPPGMMDAWMQVNIAKRCHSTTKEISGILKDGVKTLVEVSRAVYRMERESVFTIYSSQ